MTAKNIKDERRSHQRFPVVHGLMEPITIQLDDSVSATKNQPAILPNLSAEGQQPHECRG